MAINNRSKSNSGYRYGFNGMEKDDELKGANNSYDFGARIYDSRIGQFLSLDPLMKKYPHSSPYVFVNNNPILYRDMDGRDWIYYDEDGNELNRTKSKWYHGHWLPSFLGGGDRKITLSKKELEEGGFFAYVNFPGGTDLHASLVDTKTGDLFEARHPHNILDQPYNGSKYKDEEKSFYEADSRISKFEGDKENYEFANKDWWTYETIEDEDGGAKDRSPDKLDVTYIWIPNRKAILEYMNSQVGEIIDWTPFNNCKTFCHKALMEGFEGVTDQRHLEIKEDLADEDLHPGPLYNEYEKNKTIENPEKKDEEKSF